MRKSIVALLVLSLPAGVVGVAALARAQQPEVREILQQIAQGVDRDIPRTDIRFRDETGVIRAGVRCAARPVSAFERALVSNATMDFVRATGTAHRDTTKTIPVVFHVVKKGKKYDVTDQQVSDSIDVLNAAYGDHGYTFVLQETRRSKNNQFAKKCLKRNQERKFKRANAIDPATTLNIYTCRPQLGILGYATFPSDYPEDSYFHGVVLLYSSVPDGGAVPYDEGDTLVHEVGHYLGLYHTFQDGCSGTGDEVDDTPEEDEPAYGCPVGRDTCLNAPGVDPVFNYMDYTDDACMDEFTPGQKTRMDDQVATFKPSLGTSTQN